MIEVVRGTATEDCRRRHWRWRRSSRRGAIRSCSQRPINGYLINRLQHSILHEAYHLLESGIASAEMIDNVAKQLLGPRMCITGLLEQKDLAGLEMHAQAQRSIVPTLSHTECTQRVPPGHGGARRRRRPQRTGLLRLARSRRGSHAAAGERASAASARRTWRRMRPNEPEAWSRTGTDQLRRSGVRRVSPPIVCEVDGLFGRHAPDVPSSALPPPPADSTTVIG